MKWKVIQIPSWDPDYEWVVEENRWKQVSVNYLGDVDFYSCGECIVQGHTFALGSYHHKKQEILIEVSTGLVAVQFQEVADDKRTIEEYERVLWGKLRKRGVDIDYLVGQFHKFFKLWKITVETGLLDGSL